MAPGPEEYEELAKEIQRLIRENGKFLQRVMEEDFEPEEGEGEEEEEPAPEDLEEL